MMAGDLFVLAFTCLEPTMTKSFIAVRTIALYQYSVGEDNTFIMVKQVTHRQAPVL